MKINKRLALTTVAVALLAAVASLAVRPPESWTGTLFQFQFPLAANILMAILHLGAALLFIMSLSVYKAKLRLAFTGIVIGILLIGIGTVQLPILDAFNLWSTPYVLYGVVALPFLLSGLVLYFGASSFARLVGANNVFTSKLLIILAAVALSIFSTIFPHVQTTTPELSYDITNALYMWILVLDLSAAVIFLALRGRIGAHYKAAMTWLGLATLSSVTCVVIAMLDTYLSATVHSPFMLALNCMVVVAGLAWLKAGYTFTKTKEY